MAPTCATVLSGWIDYKRGGMRKIGHIERLQVQLGPLKKGSGQDRHYDPAALRTVPILRIASGGVIGLLDEQELLDVHHADHEDSRNQGGNAVSFNFTSHYDSMRERFTPRLKMGCAGENILIATGERVEPAALAHGLVIQTDQGRQGLLDRIQVAHPCRSFSAYTLQLAGLPADALLKETLQFLDGGTRGFYGQWKGEPVVVRVGDPVFLPGQ
jgi:hypothetical protein